MSHSAFDRFVSGEDRLSDLLRALPAFEPPASMVERFMTDAHHAQATQPAAQPVAGYFEPPAGMEARFNAEVSQIQADQAARRDALMAELSAGKPMEVVLGAKISRNTRAWLKAQKRALKAEKEQATRKKKKGPWWQRLPWTEISVAASAVVLGAVSTKMYFIYVNTRQETPVAMTAPQARKVAPVASVAPPAAAPAMPQATAEAPARSRVAAEPASPASPVVASASQPSESGQASGARSAQAELARSAPSQTPAALADNPSDALVARKEIALAAPVPKEIAAAAPTLAAPPAAPAPALQTAPKPMLGEERVQTGGAIAPATTPTATPAATAPAPAKDAAEANMAPAPASAPIAAPASTATTQDASLNQDPARVLRTLNFPRGKSRLIAHAAQPKRPAMHTWLAHLQAALPSDIPLEVETNDQLPADTIRLEIRAVSP